mmetsp:Transcript_20030/g.34433  ORF Transcript_20030/g.34433 Transcript_20030/m.34433 type:complete len:541 (-) Transcript_20030:651-2273(-)
MAQARDASHEAVVERQRLEDEKRWVELEDARRSGLRTSGSSCEVGSWLELTEQLQDASMSAIGLRPGLYEATSTLHICRPVRIFAVVRAWNRGIVDISCTAPVAMVVELQDGADRVAVAGVQVRQSSPKCRVGIEVTRGSLLLDGVSVELTVGGGDCCVKATGHATHLEMLGRCTVRHWGGLGVGLKVLSRAHVEVNNSVFVGNEVAAVEVAGGATTTLRHCTITGGLSHGVRVQGVSTLTMQYCSVLCNGGTGVVIEDSEGVVEKCQVHENRGSGVSVHATVQHVRLVENVLYGNEEAQIVVGGSAAPVIEGNTVRDGKHHGIACVDAAKGMIHGNEVSGNRAAQVVVQDDASTTVRGNTIRDGTNNGISIEGSARPVMVDGNSLLGNNHDQVFVRGSVALLLQGNTIRNGGHMGIVCTPEVQGVIKGNDVSGHEDAQVVLFGNTPAVEGNRIHDGGDFGIYVCSNARPTIIGNTLYGNATPQIATVGSVELAAPGNSIHDEDTESVFSKAHRLRTLGWLGLSPATNAATRKRARRAYE